MREIRVCIDVDDLERAIGFYRDVFRLQLGRRLGQDWAEMLGATSPIDLLRAPAGSKASKALPNARRDYGRHWTPVHLDFVVDDLEEVVRRARAAGAVLDRDVQERPYGRMANLADPFGHGICILQMNERGYDALLEQPELFEGDSASESG
jgi:predicted enzyme related to lactoylglutathione lyase